MLLAFVLLDTPELPTRAGIAAALGKWGFPAHFTGPPNTVLSTDTTIGTLMIMHAAVPIPNGEADAAARKSVGSFRRTASWRPHVAHLMVRVATTDHPRQPTPAVMTTFTRMVAALAEMAGAVGVYWGNGRVSHEAEFFCAMAADDSFPLVLWSGVSLARTSTSVSILTTGLRQFALPELMVQAPGTSANAALEYLFDLARYLVTRGTPIPDGDTVGRTAQERVLVRYEASPLNPGEKVAVVRFPGASRAGARH